MAKKKAKAKASANPIGATADAASEPTGPARNQLPDGKRPHDTVTFADLIAAGLIDAPSGNDGTDA